MSVVMTRKAYAGNRGIGPVTIPKQYNGTQVLVQDGRNGDKPDTTFVEECGSERTRTGQAGVAIIVSRSENRHVLRVFGRSVRVTSTGSRDARETTGYLVDMTKSFARLRFRRTLRLVYLATQ